MYLVTVSILNSPVVQEVIKASYDRVLIDEYQDCEQHQHSIAAWLSSIVPTVIFGDPMQGIFEFVETKIGWSESVASYFTHAYELETPHRWATANVGLGKWIAATCRKRWADLNYSACNRISPSTNTTSPTSVVTPRNS
ncbi:UvrD-helicase domain-containing protein [Pseudomonas syringae pv. syringae]|nr:UvrD-helicase domain-containing protein [Pseudomonas syringae pv. syringae]MCQ3008652.1 UvrD-helicase domain-containing protein [Pseudomonas savastanoi]